nr:MAG TPA: hypothetical protein [Caudoviricetes sp.]
MSYSNPYSLASSTSESQCYQGSRGEWYYFSIFQKCFLLISINT